jgi:DNA polymerase-3 subunit gamma/tau
VESTKETAEPTDAIAAAPTAPMAGGRADPSALARPAEPEQPQPPPSDSRPRTGGASAALDVLRNAGLRVSTDRNRAAVAKPAPPTAVKPAASRPPVTVPTPRPRAPEASQQQPERAAMSERPLAPAPWDDMPPLDDYPPPSSEDDYFAGPPDDGFVPMFGAGPDDVRLDARVDAPSLPSTPAVDLSKLPAPIALDAIGFPGDWPALAGGLGLTGVAHQLAFNSELTELDGQTLVLSVPVPQYADAAQVTKLKAALTDKLGKPVDVRVTVGPARRTAAVLEAAARAERQREAEREISADPFVQSLIREFGASIVPGSVRPVSPDAEAGAGAH